MKMTNEEKQAFFSQYWWQKVAIIPSYTEGDSEIISEVLNVKEIKRLEIRSVEQLEDNELVEVAMSYWGTLYFGNDPIARVSIVSEMKAKNYILPIRDSKVVDYLRSIGVLVPFRHFTPEMLIAEGVVKLKGV